MRNILITMFLGGLWHGAGWTFIFWGVLHGIFICINHSWRKTQIALPRIFCWILTFNAVNIAWIFFRANSFESAMNIVNAMFDIRNIVVPYNKFMAKYFNILSNDNTIISFSDWLNIVFIFIISCLIVDKKKAGNLNPYFIAIVLALIFIYSFTKIGQISEFLYFQF